MIQEKDKVLPWQNLLPGIAEKVKRYINFVDGGICLNSQGLTLLGPTVQCKSTWPRIGLPMWPWCMYTGQKQAKLYGDSGPRVVI